MLTVDSKTNKEEATQKLLAEKENTIQLLKKKLKIPTRQLIQDSEITKMEKGKETLHDELSDCKDKTLNFVDEKMEWEKEKLLLMENVKVLIEKQSVLEKEI